MGLLLFASFWQLICNFNSQNAGGFWYPLTIRVDWTRVSSGSPDLRACRVDCESVRKAAFLGFFCHSLMVSEAFSSPRTSPLWLSTVSCQVLIRLDAWCRHRFVHFLGVSSWTVDVYRGCCRAALANLFNSQSLQNCFVLVHLRCGARDGCPDLGLQDFQRFKFPKRCEFVVRIPVT